MYVGGGVVGGGEGEGGVPFYFMYLCTVESAFNVLAAFLLVKESGLQTEMWHVLGKGAGSRGLSAYSQPPTELGGVPTKASHQLGPA